jgi:hypothetical protein
MIRQLLGCRLPLPVVMLLILLGGSLTAQNAIVGDGFSNGWGGGSCPTGASNFKFLSEVVSGTYGVTTTAGGTGNRYFRFGIDWSGTTAHRTLTPGHDDEVTPGVTYTLSSNCTTNGAMYYNVPNGSYNYVFKTLNAGTNPTGQFVFFEVQGVVRNVTAVNRTPSSTVYGGQPVTINATLNGALSTGQAVYLRYSNDNFASSEVVEMIGSGTSYSAEIPASVNATGATVRYYVFTSGTTGVEPDGSNADLYTINLNNNSGSNYSYTTASGPTFGQMISGGNYCAGGDAFFVVMGLRPSSTSILTYNINGGPSATVNVDADGSGWGVFSVPAVLENDGLALTVTQVVWSGIPLTVTWDNSALFNIIPNGAVGGTMLGSAGVCSGNNSGTLTLTGHAGIISRWEMSWDNFATSPIYVPNNTTTLSYTNLTTTTYYRAVLTDGTCPPVNSTVAVITVSTQPNAGTLSGGTTVCGGSNNGFLILSGHSGGTVARWESSTDNFATTPTVIANTLAYYEFNNVTATTYYRAVVVNGSCEAYSNVQTVTIGPSTTWNGATWSNGAPMSGSAAYFTANYNVPGDIYACSIVVSGGADVIIPSGYSVHLDGTITVEEGSSFTLANNANLFQPDGVVNESPITVIRNSSPLMRLDYTLWSSPVADQGLRAFSPLTVVNPTVRFYNYNTGTNVYNSVPSINTAKFQAGKGYLIRMPDNHPDTPTAWPGTFNGVPHNGEYTVDVENSGFGNSFNLIGNPYPSPIDLYAFLAENMSVLNGSMYFWRKTNASSTPAYCVWNWGTYAGNGEDNILEPFYILRTGQGVIVDAEYGPGTLVFNNSQRIDDHTDEFFRATESADKHRLWLDLTGQNVYSQCAIVYSEGGTTGVDQFDARYFNDGPARLTMKVSGAEYVIQSRGLFDTADVVPMTFSVTAAGSYQIEMAKMDGLFLEDQNVFLRDNVLGVVHNVKSSPYTFSTEAGVFEGRFDVIYEGALGVQNPGMSANSIVVYRSGDAFTVDAGNVVIKDIKAYDLQGRLIAKLEGVSSTQTSISLGATKQVVVLEIVAEGGAVVHKKVVN